MPISIPETLENLAQKAARGENPKWHVTLALIGIIDVEKSTRTKTVCTQPNDFRDYQDLMQKVDCLRPYQDLDPLVSNVIRIMDKIRTYPNG